MTEPRMDTNEHECSFQSTEYTEETECLADVGQSSEEFVDNMLFYKGEIGKASVCSAVRHASRKRKQRHAEASSPWTISFGRPPSCCGG